ncbi:hypothetical protein DSLASN_11920 [Desulfoluna limicola]|uniref:Uncharacterized protein n=1 Tax=Desulfoluna limicola TaxID=2810562 RepID=A0ABN6F222_9BACT|nr:hypothetical protein [Desulfoluna limicola]BCS95560.1 hypothetical protein DSLASN_11920 [Desulfoluna limicola]
MKPLYLFSFCAIFLSLLFTHAHALQSLSTGQMKEATAQAGISIALKNVKIESYDTGYTISNPDDPLQYLSFQNGHSTLELTNSSSDLNGDGLIGCITIDLFTVNAPVNPAFGQPFFYLKSNDMELDYDLTIDTVTFCGNDIGSITLNSFAMPSFHLYLGAHDSGIDAELGAQISIEQFNYGTHGTDNLVLSGITFAEAFTGFPSDDPTTWQPTGKFTIGDIASGNPMTMDIAADNTDVWQFTDKGGADYTVTNPRSGSGFIAINMPVQGSIRIDNMNFGGNDLGSFALDNIQAHKLYMEIPGRGLGVPQPPTP